MDIPVIKKLVEKHTLEELRDAEAALADEKEPSINVEGDDIGDQLTHAYAAYWIKNKVQNEGLEFKDALRAYTSMIRNSIS